ncbi:MAG: aspartate aminotransferase family protein [Alphaproteobacteria bacterium]
MITPSMPVFKRIDVAFDRGEGAYLYGTDGRRYLDFASGIAVTMLGHAHPHLVAALEKQAHKLWHCSNLFRIPEQERLAERLVAHSFADTVFFANSGAEAIECGLKLVRKYHDATGNPQRYRMICANGAFHGRTLATIAAGGQEKHLKGFEPAVDGFDHVSYNNLNELRAAVTEETAGILLEPVIGEGGIRPASREYLEGVRKVADEFGLLLFFDEVQTGAGRMGSLFAYEAFGVKPDVMAVAKGFGGGFPVGACLATERAAVGMTYGTHGSTFGGNPLAMAVGNAVLDVLLGEGFLDNVKRMATLTRARLQAVVTKYPNLFEEVRGMGMMLGLKCRVSSETMIDRLLKNGLLAVGAGENVVRLAPPLIIDERHVEEAVAIIDRSCATWAEVNG